jgi:hypothetical protein
MAAVTTAITDQCPSCVAYTFISVVSKLMLAFKKAGLLSLVLGSVKKDISLILTRKHGLLAKDNFSYSLTISTIN